jgi:hypothetical protein
MTKIVLDVDDSVIAKMALAARLHGMSVEALLKQRVEGMVDLTPFELHNPSHRAKLKILEEGKDLGQRAQTHDRDRQRAETYRENKRNLLKLIDTTEGDMGEQTWNRAHLYEC